MTHAQINALGEEILARYELVVNDIFDYTPAVTSTELELLLRLQGLTFYHFEWVADRCGIEVHRWDKNGEAVYIWTKKEAISES